MGRTLFILAVVFSVSLFGQRIMPFYGPFPYPAPNKNMLFYLQRTVNRNTLIYELNYEMSGELNPKEPVKVYWIDFEDGAKISPLTFLQRKFGYGIRSRTVDGEAGIYEVALVSYDKIKILIKRHKHTNHYYAEVAINGKAAVLNKIFIQIIGGTQTSPVVSYIELSGHDPETEVMVSERIKPIR